MLVVCAYGLCYFALTRAMSTIPTVGVAYSLWCGFGIVGVTICSMILYKQKPDGSHYRHGADYLRRRDHERLLDHVTAVVLSCYPACAGGP